MPASNDNGDAPPGATPIIPATRCPMCGKPTQLSYRPFCSKRCSDLDLSRWLNGVYAVPAAGTDEDEDERE